MKKTITRILAVIIAFTLIVSAIPVAFAADTVASGTAGEGVNWVLDADGTLTISGEGDIVVEWYNPPWYDYSDSILNVVVEEGITKIPSTAFCYEKNLISISIPASVINMDDDEVSMIWACYAIEEINVDPENPIYTSVDGVVFDKDMTRLCFYPANKAGDTYVIPNSVTKIANSAFGWVQQLQHITVPDTVIALGNDAFRLSSIKSITIGSGIKEIPNACFSSSEIENIVIPDNVETISSSAFWSCDELKHITIGTGIKSIDTSAFGYCDALTAIHYAGTEAQWNEVQINGDVQYIEPFAVHYKTDISDMDTVEATCTTSGHTAGKYCSACGGYITGEVTDEAYGHDFADGICQRDDCGYKCEHLINDIFDDKCDDCGEKIELNIPEIKLDETKNVLIDEAHEPVYLKYIPKESGRYVLFSDNGGDHDNIDPYVKIYDSNFKYMSSANDKDDGDFNFSCTFDAVAGEEYYFELSDYQPSEYKVTLEKYIVIDHQPTSSEPYVELTWDIDSTYQWYSVDTDKTQITDQNANVITYDWGSSSYSAENGWSGVNFGDSETGYEFFSVDLKKDEVLTVEIFGDYRDGVGIFDHNSEKGEWINFTYDSTYKLTAPVDGNYVLYSYSMTGDITVKAYLSKYTYTKLENQTTNTLKKPVIGETYACMVTVKDTVVTSEIFEYTYAIINKPTTKEPCVELNDATDAKYQWYSVKDEIKEITDKDVTFIPGIPEELHPTYDAEKGWTSVIEENSTSTYFFNLPLKKGETISFEIDGNATHVALISIAGMVFEEVEFDENGKATFAAPVEGEYHVFLKGEATLKAYKPTTTYTKLDGETSAKLKNPEVGETYVCEVIFKDGSKQMSERVKITDIQNESTDNNTAAGDTTSPNTSDDMIVFVAALLLVAIMGAAKAFKKCKI